MRKAYIHYLKAIRIRAILLIEKTLYRNDTKGESAMKNRNEVLRITVLILGALLITVLCMLFYYRKKSFREILPLPYQPGDSIVQIMYNDMNTFPKLSAADAEAFLADMEQFQYRHVTNEAGMDSFGRVIYMTHGESVEIMFSNERGGSILVNKVGQNKKQPVYQIIGTDPQLEKLFDTYVHLADENN